MAVGILLMGLVPALILIYYWVSSFAYMMTYKVADFPGRHDKILWVAIFLLAAPVAPFVFSMYRRLTES